MTNAAPTTPIRIWLITGATSGIGRELTRQALDAGEAVVALARDTRSLDDFGDNPHLLRIEADVRDA